MNKNKGLDHDEQLLFEVGDINKTGVDLDEIDNLNHMIGDSFSENGIGLAGLSEPETIRHYVRLSRKNYSIDAGLYPLGSCTMKHNPRLNEKMARLEGFSDIHPLQPISTCQGALELIDLISSWLKELTGMAAVTMTPKAGAQGELCGMMAIKQALLDRNELNRKVVLVPDSAHGTNPATAAFLGFEVKTIKSNDKGLIDFSDFKNNIDENFFVMEDSAHARFDEIVQTFVSLDTDAAITLYRTLSPLFQQAYAEIGFRNVSFDETLRLSINNIVRTTNMEGTYQLVKPSVMYLYADASIENLQEVHKQLLRIGPDNTTILKAKLREFASQL